MFSSIKSSRKKGATFLEVLAIIAIMGILLSTSAQGIISVRKKALGNSVLTRMNIVNAAIATCLTAQAGNKVNLTGANDLPTGGTEVCVKLNNSPAATPVRAKWPELPGAWVYGPSTSSGDILVNNDPASPLTQFQFDVESAAFTVNLYDSYTLAAYSQKNVAEYEAVLCTADGCDHVASMDLEDI